MLTDYGTPFRHKLIRPTWFDRLWDFLTEPQPEPEQVTKHPTCRCMAFQWEHGAKISEKCRERRRLDGFRED